MRSVGEEPCRKFRSQAHRAALAPNYVYRTCVRHSIVVTNPPAEHPPFSFTREEGPTPAQAHGCESASLGAHTRPKVLLLEHLTARLPGHRCAALRIDFRRRRCGMVRVLL